MQGYVNVQAIWSKTCVLTLSYNALADSSAHCRLLLFYKKEEYKMIIYDPLIAPYAAPGTIEKLFTKKLKIGIGGSRVAGKTLVRKPV
uniref:Uncharacterized protein n=1 Tax=Tetranychus urticae TaxID=32264 RepID=T1KG77_TETUR